ncbi:MAG: glutathione-regulated potassium-efflux system protein KefC [Myxococcales bacterium]
MAEHGSLLDALIFLGGAVVFVPLASRLGLGSVLGYLLAGCAIGPHLLGLVRNVDSIMHFAELGVVLMLFVIGLELDPKRLWGMRRLVFGGGALQMLSCSVAIGAAGMAVGLAWQPALIAGLALALSSTAIAVQTMNERNLLNSPLGRASFGVLLFQDLAAIPIMSVVPLLSTAADAKAGGDLSSALKGIAALAVTVGVGRFLTRPLLQVVARTGLREVFTSVALLIVLGVAQLMTMAGLSMGLGAFLAGVLLAGSEFRHALEADIEPFKGLLMGLFFMSVGMAIDFGLLASHPLFVLALVAGYQVIKAGVLALIAPRLSVAKSQSGLFAALLAQGGEFAFVVLGVAKEAKALPGNWGGLLTLTVALSMALTPLLLWIQGKADDRRASANARQDDVIEHDGSQVIIAGFGRFGQIVGRMLFASGIRATVLDHDPDQIEVLRRFGFRIFYGDATRVDLLHTAGAAKAKLLINAIDGIDDSLQLVDRVKEHFPQLTIVSRARNVSHYFELRSRGVNVVERETFEAAITMGQKALINLGVAPYEAHERADRFRRHNVRALEAVLPYLDDEARRLSMARAAREELEKQFERDMAALNRIGSAAWQADLEGADEARAE